MTLKTITALIALLGIAATAAQPVLAVEPGKPSVAAAPSNAEAQARRVVRDRDSGKMRMPTSEEAAAMDVEERAARRASGLPEVEEPTALVIRRHTNGMYSAKLGPEHLVTVTATRGADGRLIRSHDKAIHEHQATAPAAAAKE